MTLVEGFLSVQSRSVGRVLNGFISFHGDLRGASPHRRIQSGPHKRDIGCRPHRRADRLIECVPHLSCATQRLVPFFADVLVRGLRQFWVAPDPRWKLCDCGWRPDLGPHYAITQQIESAEEVE